MSCPGADIPARPSEVRADGLKRSEPVGRSARSSTGPAVPFAYRLYRPATPGPHPIVVYFHGGGVVLGDALSDDPFCRDLCRRSGISLLSCRPGPLALRGEPLGRPACWIDGLA